MTDNFGLFTEIAVCKFLLGLAVVWPETFLFCPLYVFIHFPAPFWIWRIVPLVLLGIMRHRNVHYYYYCSWCGWVDCRSWCVFSYVPWQCMFFLDKKNDAVSLQKVVKPYSICIIVAWNFYEYNDCLALHITCLFDFYVFFVLLEITCNVLFTFLLWDFLSFK